MNLQNRMRVPWLGAGLFCLAATAFSPAFADPPRAPAGREGGRMAMPRMEPQRDPRGYQRFGTPPGIEHRPSNLDRGYYGHHFQANHIYHVGPYHAPPGFAYRRWVIGEILPPPFWVRDYWLSDYWLFGLDIPPVGYEWVRYGPDALLIDTNSGDVVQVVYGLFG